MFCIIKVTLVVWLGPLGFELLEMKLVTVIRIMCVHMRYMSNVGEARTVLG